MGALEKSMRNAYANKARLRQMGANGREFVLANITYAKLVTLYEELLRKLGC